MDYCSEPLSVFYARRGPVRPWGDFVRTVISQSGSIR